MESGVRGQNRQYYKKHGKKHTFLSTGLRVEKGM
jgi:hypothetical protein